MMAVATPTFSKIDTPSYCGYFHTSEGSARHSNRRARQDSTSSSSPMTPLNANTGREINNTNIYISGLPRTVTDRDFESLVSQYGQIFSYKIVHKGPQTPPVGFVQYTTPTMAQQAVAGLNGMLFHGTFLKAKMALRDKDKGVNSKPSANLYICNLPSGFTTEDLRRTFEKYGKIISLVALTNPATGQSRGTGFVRFSSVKEARIAKEALHGTQLHPVLPLEVKFAESSAERSNRLKTRIEAETQAAKAPSSPKSPELTPSSLPTSPVAPVLSPLHVPLPPLSGLGESYHKRQRPAPLLAPEETSAWDVPEETTAWDIPSLNLDAPASNNLLQGITEDPLDSIIDDVFSNSQLGQEPFAALQLEVSSGHCSGSDPWDTCGPSDDSLEASPLMDSGVLGWEMLGGFENRRVSQMSVLDSRIWRFVEQDSPKSDSFSPPPGSPVASKSSTICIENLPSNSTEIDLYKLCAQYGAISQVNLNMDGTKENCLAFIQFKHSQDAQEAQARLNHMVHCGQQLLVTL